MGAFYTPPSKTFISGQKGDIFVDESNTSVGHNTTFEWTPGVKQAAPKKDHSILQEGWVRCADDSVIHPETLYESRIAIRTRGEHGRLLPAVWHDFKVTKHWKGYAVYLNKADRSNRVEVEEEPWTWYAFRITIQKVPASARSFKDRKKDLVRYISRLIRETENLLLHKTSTTLAQKAADPILTESFFRLR